MPDTTHAKLLAGALELCDLPQLGIHALHARVDTGAATSSLHVDNIEEFTQDARPWVSFDIHPDICHVEQTVRRTARVRGRRTVKNTSGAAETRILIHTRLRMGGQEWKIHLTLTNRTGMSYLMLLGRQAMKGRVMVDPDVEYLLSNDRAPAGPQADDHNIDPPGAFGG